MVILTPFYEKVIGRLQTLFDSIAHFSVAKGHKIVLLATHRIEPGTLLYVREKALEAGFDEAMAIMYGFVQSWPEAANQSFYEGARWIQTRLQKEECFMLLEHDCTITGPEAFDTLYDDWKFHNTAVCGTLNFAHGAGLFTHGVAVYHKDIVDMLGADNLTSCGNQPYDIYLREWLLPLTSITCAIEQTQRLENLSIDSVLLLNRNTLIHHPCKDGSLFRSLLTHEWSGRPLTMREVAPSGVSSCGGDASPCLSRARCSSGSFSATVAQLKKVRASSGPYGEHPS